MVTNCEFAPVEPGYWRCRVCGLRAASKTGRIWAACKAAAASPSPARCGPGCHLARSLARCGFRDDGACGCQQFANEMDAWGPQTCRARLDTDIMPRLRAKAAERGAVFVEVVARALVLRAIRRAEREAASVKADGGPPSV